MPSKKLSLKAGRDITRPDVSLEIGGKVRPLAYDFAAIVKAEEITGINLLKAATFQDLSFTQVRGLLYAALLHDDPSLTLATLDSECGPEMVQGLAVIQVAIAEAWFGSVPDAKDDTPAGEAPAQATN